MKQELMILRDLMRGKRITPLDALNRYGSFRLGARIFDLRQRGYDIQTRIVEKHGKRFAEYWLPEIN